MNENMNQVTEQVTNEVVNQVAAQQPKRLSTGAGIAIGAGAATIVMVGGALLVNGVKKLWSKHKAKKAAAEVANEEVTPVQEPENEGSEE